MESESGGLTLDDCVNILCKDKAVRRKPPTTDNGKSVLETLQEEVTKKGLTEEQIIQLISVAASKKYTDAVASFIIKCLVPRNQVPAISVVNTVSWLCTNLLSTSLQVAFLKWLILVYQWIDDKTTVHCLYGILFLFLDKDALCPYVCHLLYYMTRKEDVLLFRLRKLLDLLVKVGAQPHLLGLLSLYKVHSPYLVSMNIPKTRKAFFKRKDAKWLDIAWNIQSLNVIKPVDRSSSPLNEQAILALPAAKRRRKEVIIPSFQPSIRDEDQPKHTRITVDRISCFNDFLSNFDKLEFPNQMGTVLGSRYLQHLMVCWHNEGALLRFNFWIHQTLQEELLTAPSGETRTRVAEFLDEVLKFVSFVKEPIPSLETCLTQYLYTWNGVDYQPQVLLLISHLQVGSFHKLNDLVLEPLRKLFFCSSVHFKCQVLTCFTEMLLNLANSTMAAPVKDANSNTLTTTPVSNLSKGQTSQIMNEFIGFVDRISAVALQVQSDHVLLQHWILCFFEQVSVLHRQYDVQFVHIPSAAIIYRLLFASNPMVLARLCKLIVNYKNEFELLKSVKSNSSSDDAPFLDGLDSIAQLNRYILDISDTLWRNRAFVDRSKSLCYSIPRPVTDAFQIPHINETFSIYNHVALVYLAKKFLVQTQQEEIKLNPNLIRGKIRGVYLEFLRRHRLHGIISFLDTFIKQKVS